MPWSLISHVNLSFKNYLQKKYSQNEIVSQDALSKIKAFGFSTENAMRVDGAYLVEGDIVLTDDDLNAVPDGTKLRIAEVEQYHTFNLVCTPRTITVSTSGTVHAAVLSAIDAAIARYNAENLLLTFSRVSSGGNINIRIVNGGPYIASAGFPTLDCKPYGEVKFNRQYQNYSSGLPDDGYCA